jgi:alpha-glucosidase
MRSKEELMIKGFPAVAVLVALCLAGSPLAGKTYTLVSPGRKVQVNIEVGPRVSYSVTYGSNRVLAPSFISMTINDNVILGRATVVERVEPRSVDETIRPAVRVKRALVPDRYSELTIRIRGNYGLCFRAYDDGAAYRFFTGYRREIKINSEETTFAFPEGSAVWFPFTDSLHTSFESRYVRVPLAGVGSKRFGYAPVVVEIEGGPRVAVAEADLEDYPGMFLTGNDRGLPELKGLFAPFPLEEKLREKSDRELEVVKAADHIAMTRGNRTYPWRVVAVADTDAGLVGHDLLYRLAGAPRIKDGSWIRPGKVAWDWWNANNVYGVDFKAGINTATYEKYIDFASRSGLEYVILDEGWSNPGDLFKINPEIDMAGLAAHAAEKKVGLVLWCVWLTLDRQMDKALDQFANWGVRGIKVDFMDRDDQKMVGFYWRCAEAAARRRLIVDFHGAHLPAGLYRAYPNVLTSEGLMGLEYAKWSDSVTPDHDLSIPFTRMLAGPMDYTPGAMRNAGKDQFRPVFDLPMSQGTRCHQLAMFVVYESPFQMLCDSPSAYEREPEILGFLSGMPTVWDETKPLDGKIGAYLILARKSGPDWYAAAMTDWTPRTMDLRLDFLEEGTYEAEILSDGLNADRYAPDYRREVKTLRREDSLKVEMASGGGWVARFRKKTG